MVRRFASPLGLGLGFLVALFYAGAGTGAPQAGTDVERLQARVRENRAAGPPVLPRLPPGPGWSLKPPPPPPDHRAALHDEILRLPLESVLALLQSEYWELRLCAAETLDHRAVVLRDSAVHTERVRQAVRTELLRERQAIVLTPLLDLFADLQIAGASERLAHLAENGETIPVRAAAVEALSRTGDASVLPVLQRAASDKLEAIRLAAVPGVARLSRAEEIEAARRDLHSDDRNTRYRGMKTLVDLKDGASWACLATLLDYPERELAREASKMLGDLGTQHAADALTGWLDRSPEESPAREWMKFALAHLRGRPGLRAAVAWYEKHPEEREFLPRMVGYASALTRERGVPRATFTLDEVRALASVINVSGPHKKSMNRAGLVLPEHLIAALVLDDWYIVSATYGEEGDYFVIRRRADGWGTARRVSGWIR